MIWALSSDNNHTRPSLNICMKKLAESMLLGDSWNSISRQVVGMSSQRIASREKNLNRCNCGVFPDELKKRMAPRVLRTNIRRALCWSNIFAMLYLICWTQYCLQLSFIILHFVLGGEGSKKVATKVSAQSREAAFAQGAHRTSPCIKAYAVHWDHVPNHHHNMQKDFPISIRL